MPAAEPTTAVPDARHRQLVGLADRYRELAAENYVQIRSVAEQLRDGLCGWFGTAGPPCVRLVPAEGPFDAREYGDAALSMPGTGFQKLEPIAFGLAVRVSETDDWLRVTLICRKEGATFTLQIKEGESVELPWPLDAESPLAFYEGVHAHLARWFAERIELYEQGEYGHSQIGFDFSRFRAEG
jgi:hypothetical protein